MALIISKPTSPGKRGEIRVVHKNLHKGKPHAPLTESREGPLIRPPKFNHPKKPQWMPCLVRNSRRAMCAGILPASCGRVRSLRWAGPR